MKTEVRRQVNSQCGLKAVDATIIYPGSFSEERKFTSTVSTGTSDTIRPCSHDTARLYPGMGYPRVRDKLSFPLRALDSLAYHPAGLDGRTTGKWTRYVGGAFETALPDSH